MSDTVRVYLDIDDGDWLTMHHAALTDDPQHVYDVPARTWEMWVAIQAARGAMVDDIANTYVFPRRGEAAE